MKFIFLLSLFCSLSFSALGEEVFRYPVVDIQKKLERSVTTFLDDPKTCPEMKTAEDEECQISLGWGHSRHSHNALGDKCGIGMGCNSGEAGTGPLQKKNQYWRWQRGSNGTFSNYSQQGTQNGGLNPVIFEGRDDDREGRFDKNSYLGFMRMTQYHWLQLHNYANDELLGKTCSSVRIEFMCSDVEADLDDSELRRRLDAHQVKLTVSSEGFDQKYAAEIEIMNRVEPLRGCFAATSGKFDALPEKCGQKMDITAAKKMAPSCQAWVKSIQAMPQHNWNTPSNLERPQSYNYPPTGPVH